MSGPTEAGFLAFIRTSMRINTTVLPTAEPAIGEAYNAAKTLVNPSLATVPNANAGYLSVYARAIYNLGGHFLVAFAPDQTSLTYFADLRAKLGFDNFVAGVINSTNDNGTSQSMTVPEAMNTLTFQDLQTLKSPWGRVYLGLAQSYGPTIWGMS